MKCPKCSLINPNSSTICDCGYNLSSNTPKSNLTQNSGFFSPEDKDNPLGAQYIKPESRSKNILAKTIIVFGYLFIILQFLSYFSPLNPLESYIDSDLELKSREVPKIDYYLSNPINSILYGVHEGDGRYIADGIMLLIIHNMLLVLGLMIIGYKKIYKYFFYPIAKITTIPLKEVLKKR